MARLLHLLLIFFFVVTPSLILPSSSQPLNNDANTLLKFKQGLTDPNGVLNNWNSGKSPCVDKTNISTWAGVLCNNDEGVLGLLLEGMNLSGKLDLAILNGIPTLRVLSFVNNNFEGAMPDVKAIKNLKAIYLSNNKFSGPIPEDAFKGMGVLKKVFLARNKFSGEIPKSLADLPKLLEVSLEDNEFSGKIPDLRQNNLALVNLSNNNLTGQIPSSLAKMGPKVVEGNKNLCGPPLQNACIGLQTEVPSSSLSDDKPTTSSSSPLGGGMIVILLAVLVIIIFSGIIILRRNQTPVNELGNPASKKLDDLELGSAETPAKSIGSAETPARSIGSPNSTSTTGGGAGTHEQGKLVFVIQGRERFELQDLLKSSAVVLGTGSLGCSYKATVVNGASMVVKRFRDMNRVGKEDFEEHMRRLGRLSHPNLLPLVSYYYRKEEKLLVTDYVQNRSLAHFLYSGDRKMKAALDWVVRLKIVKGVAQGLSYLFDELSVLNVPHGHLKSSNVLLGVSFDPLLSDYALVPVVNQSHANNVMAAFRSPEKRQMGRPSKKSDVWCLGNLILEILTGKPGIPISDTSSHKGQVHDISLWVISVPEDEWMEEVIDADLVKDLKLSADIETVKTLMRIGIACCEPDMDKRCDMKDAVDKIEELVAIGGDKENDAEASFQTVDEEFSTVVI